eukprot:11224099-Lingulodinium_polyedra.AAC.1
MSGMLVVLILSHLGSRVGDEIAHRCGMVPRCKKALSSQRACSGRNPDTATGSQEHRELYT